jgi:hypothetical protein
MTTKTRHYLGIYNKEEMIDFALYFWSHGEGKTATRDGANHHFDKWTEKNKETKK